MTNSPAKLISNMALYIQNFSQSEQIEACTPEQLNTNEVVWKNTHVILFSMRSASHELDVMFLCVSFIKIIKML